MKYVAACVLAGWMISAASAQEPSAKGVNFYSREREVQLGREVAATLGRELPIVRLPKLDAYISRLGAQLGKYASTPDAYTFTVYDDGKPAAVQPDVLAMPEDAFLLPAREPVAVAGGPIFVPLSLLADSPGEGAFAFQLAHAMAHIVLRHSTKIATRREIVRIGGQAIEGRGSPIAASFESAMQLGVQVSTITFARACERRADRAAVGIMASAGYNPDAAIPYLESQTDASQRPRAFSAHPTSSVRVEAIRSASANLPPGLCTAATGAFAEAKALAAVIR